VFGSFDRCLIPLSIVALFFACAPRDPATPELTRLSSTPSSPVVSVTSASPLNHDAGHAGAWSPIVDGLRARMIREAAPSSNGPRLAIEVENTSSEPREIYWLGRPSLGYVTFRLFEGAREVGEPDWRFGGNEPGGSMRESLAPGSTIRRSIDAAYTDMNGKRALRIGAFWGREVPEKGAQLGGVLRGGPADPKAMTLNQDRVVAPDTIPHGRAWLGSIEIPPIPIE
jgi:hypothetical protein